MPDVIIGVGAAGVGCVEAIRRRDKEREIIMVAPDRGAPYSRPMLYYALAKKISLENIHFRAPDFYHKNSIKFIPGWVKKIEVEKRNLILDGGEEIKFNNLLIATGGVPKFPIIKGIEKQGVFGFRTLNDLERICAYAEKVKQAVILGGGNIGLQTAEGLNVRGLKCTVVVKSPFLLSQIADEETSEIFRHHLKKNGINIITGTDAREIVGKESVEGVALDDGSKLDCGMVIVGKGMKPDLKAVEGSGIKCRNGVVADDYLMTSRTGIYAAGDIAEVKDRLTGEWTTVGIWPAAFEQGQYVAWNIMGHQQKYPGALRMNATEFFDLHLISIGLVNPKGENFEIFRKRRGDNYRKLVFNQGKLWGAILVGEVKGAGVLNWLIKSQLEVSDIKRELLENEVDLGKLMPILNRSELMSFSREHRELIFNYNLSSLCPRPQINKGDFNR